MKYRQIILSCIKPVASVILGLSAGLVVAAIAGEDPFHVLKILANSAFGTQYDFGMTLFYTTPLIFTGLSVAFAFHAGLFNIGAEGQLTLGALGTAAVGICFPSLPILVAPLVAIAAAFVSGAFWGAIPGWLKAKRGSHEVINTIMLNFIAAGLSSYVTLYLLRNTGTQNPETLPVGENYLLRHFDFFGGSPVSFALVFAILAAVGVWFLLWRTVIGYEIRAVGQNELASRAVGIQISRVRILSMAVAGGLAGLVGLNDVLGNEGIFKLGFSPGYGFTGIAVALLGRNHPLGVVISAFLFGALHKGTANLDLETENVTRDLSSILQAMIILCVSASGMWDFVFRKFSKEVPAKGV